MINTPKSLRLQVAIFGRANSGKSTLLNAIADQDVAITSPTAGTTTDVVEKAMELLPLGPVLFLDTAGVDDPTALGALRVERTRRVFERADAALLVVESGRWGDPEESVIAAAAERGIGVVAVVNKCDRALPDAAFLDLLRGKTHHAALAVSALDTNRDLLLGALKSALIEVCPDDFVNPPPLLSDLVNEGDAVALVVPIDKQAPKGRLILPQVQCIREALDCGAVPFLCRETEYVSALAALKKPPVLAVCDSQVVHLAARDTPETIPLTTFSILFARLKGDFSLLAAGAAAIGKLRPRDKVMIAEACTHHATEDDIGRVKIPNLLRKKLGFAPEIKVVSGHDYPADLGEYKLVIHCGACMLNRRETLRRIAMAHGAGCAVTNYGMAISYCGGVLERVLSPFPKALDAYRRGGK